MSVTESKKTFSDEFKEYFRTKDFHFNKFPSESTGNYHDLNKLLNYISKEAQFWEEVVGNIKGNHQPQNMLVIYIRDGFKTLTDQLDALKSQSFNDENKKQLDQILHQISIQQFPRIHSVSEHAQMIKAITEKYEPIVINGYVKTAFEGQHNNLKINSNEDLNSSFFLGRMMANHIKAPEIGGQVFEGQQESYRKLIDEINKEYDGFVDTIISDRNKLKNEFKRTKDQIENERESYSQKLDKLINTKKEIFLDLEHQYREHLKLKEPADYWNEAADDYEKKGEKWKKWSIWAGVIFAGLLTLILILSKSYSGFNFSSVRFTVILTVVVSIGFLILNLLIKLSTSNFHLANDAKERHHLTYVYLALLKEAEIEGEEKSIVLQSLFSRSESGLIRSETGQQLPGQTLNTLIKHKN